MRRERTVLFLLAGGFLLTAVEVRYLHREVLAEHWQAWVPVVYGAIGTAMAVIAAALAQARRLAAGVFALGVLAGLLGFYLHTEGNPAQVTKMLGPSLIAHADEDDERRASGESHEGSEEPPSFAPLGLAGLAAIGFVCTSKLFAAEKR